MAICYSTFCASAVSRTDVKMCHHVWSYTTANSVPQQSAVSVSVCGNMCAATYGHTLQHITRVVSFQGQGKPPPSAFKKKKKRKKERKKERKEKKKKKKKTIQMGHIGKATPNLQAHQVRCTPMLAFHSLSFNCGKIKFILHVHQKQFLFFTSIMIY